MKSIRERMSGNEAVAYAIRQVNPDVMPAFPITPSTEIPPDGLHLYCQRRDRYRIHTG